VVDYRAQPILKGLSGAASDGIDVYFDNVGGDHLDAALALARNHARFAICGMIAGYNAKEPASFRFIPRIIAARIMLKGFLVFDYFPRMGEFYAAMGPWVADGTVKARETVVDGLENMPEAFLGLFKGENTGKMLVKL
jgi:NADPH-dependent curcumin reductase CurA